MRLSKTQAMNQKSHTHIKRKRKRISHFLDLWIIIPIRGDVYEQFF